MNGIEGPADGAATDSPDLAPPQSGCDPQRLSTDPLHCGRCDNDCTRLPNVDASKVTCVAGACSLSGACTSGFADCTSAPGCETNLSTPEHCGACSTPCGAAAALCSVDGSGQRQCTSSCGSGAPNQCGNQCVDLNSDPMHCGTCTNHCTAPTGGSASCTMGHCASGCGSGTHACNGACVSDSSVSSCGSSCSPCPGTPHGHATCDGVRCDFACFAGYTKMGGACVANTGSCTASGDNCTDNSDCCSAICVNTCL